MKHSVTQFLKNFAGIFFITLVLLELALRIWGKYYTYSEKASNRYISLFNQKLGSWYFLEKPFSSFKDVRGEFQFLHSVDSLGCNWYNTPAKADTAALKILVMGDSFTFGIGAAQDSCWPKLLADMLRTRCQRNVQVINGSRQASDPFFSYVNYRDILKQLQPDLILLTLNSTDILEVYSRGGWDRFKADSTVQTKTAPWFEPLYHYSHVCRMVLYFWQNMDNEYLSNANQYGKVATAAAAQLQDCMVAFNRDAVKNNSKLIVLNFPLPREIKDKEENQFLKYSPGLVALPFVNSAPDSLFRNYYKGHNISNYYWPKDGHFNADGYRVMAEQVYQILITKNETIKAGCGNAAN